MSEKIRFMYKDNDYEKISYIDLGFFNDISLRNMYFWS